LDVCQLFSQWHQADSPIEFQGVYNSVLKEIIPKLNNIHFHLKFEGKENQIYISEYDTSLTLKDNICEILDLDFNSIDLKKRMGYKITFRSFKRDINLWIKFNWWLSNIYWSGNI
jgi:hypothetical protein